MKKRKLIIILIGVISILALTSFFLLHIFCYKGEPINLIDLSKENESTKIELKNQEIENCSANECLYILNWKIANSSHYKSTVEGKVKSGIYTQTVNNKKYKSNNLFLAETKSTSTFVNVGKQIFFSEDKIIVRDATNISEDKWNNKFIEFNLNGFLTEYGVDQRQLTNYILNDETIISSELVSKENELYTFKYILDIEKATPNYKINMVKMGNLNSLPKFTSCEVTITMNKFFEPITINSCDKYKVSKIGLSLTCTSNLTENFSNFNDTTLEIPNLSIFQEAINKISV